MKGNEENLENNEHLIRLKNRNKNKHQPHSCDNTARSYDKELREERVIELETNESN